MGLQKHRQTQRQISTVEINYHFPRDTGKTKTCLSIPPWSRTTGANLD